MLFPPTCVPQVDAPTPGRRRYDMVIQHRTAASETADNELMENVSTSCQSRC